VATFIDVEVLKQKKAELEQSCLQLAKQLDAQAGALSLVEHLLGDDVPKIEVAEAVVAPADKE